MYCHAREYVTFRSTSHRQHVWAKTFRPFRHSIFEAPTINGSRVSKGRALVLGAQSWPPSSPLKCFLVGDADSDMFGTHHALCRRSPNTLYGCNDHNYGSSTPWPPDGFAEGTPMRRPGIAYALEAVGQSPTTAKGYLGAAGEGGSREHLWLEPGDCPDPRRHR